MAVGRKRADLEASRDARLKVSKQTRDALKAISAMRGEPLYALSERVLQEFIKTADLAKHFSARTRGK
jgi:hypothetical protein